jgi:hypothetical protein
MPRHESAVAKGSLGVSGAHTRDCLPVKTHQGLLERDGDLSGGAGPSRRIVGGSAAPLSGDAASASCTLSVRRG